jgi:hypothetical protein
VTLAARSGPRSLTPAGSADTDARTQRDQLKCGDGGLAADEALFRKDRVAKILATRARFRSSAEIDDWDGTYDRGVAKAKLKELASLGFFLNQENLLLLGKTGEGKTHLAVALGRRLCAEGIQTTFLSVNLLFEEFAAAKAAGKYLPLPDSSTSPRCSSWMTRTPLVHARGSDNPVDLLEDRYQRGVVVVTSQVDPCGWLKLFEDPFERAGSPFLASRGQIVPYSSLSGG